MILPVAKGQLSLYKSLIGELGDFLDRLYSRSRVLCIAEPT